MQRPEPSERDEFPEEPVAAHEPSGDFEVLVSMIEHQAPHLLGVTLPIDGKRKAFHTAVETALRELGFDFVFERKRNPGEVPMPDGVRLHSEAEMHKPGEIGRILLNGEFVATLRKELVAAGVLHTPEQRATTSGSGAFQTINGTSSMPPARKVEKSAA